MLHIFVVIYTYYNKYLVRSLPDFTMSGQVVAPDLECEGTSVAHLEIKL